MVEVVTSPSWTLGIDNMQVGGVVHVWTAMRDDSVLTSNDYIGVVLMINAQVLSMKRRSVNVHQCSSI